MKRYLLSTATLAILSTTLVGCGSVQTKDNHTYVDGKCITCFNNPFTGKPINHEEKDSQLTNTQDASTKSVEDIDHGENQDFAPGSTFSELQTHTENIPLSVDMAYVKSKKFLKFYDVNDEIPPSKYVINRAKITAIPATYYSVNHSYGGPRYGLNWVSQYDLQLEKITEKSTKVTIKYKIYSNGINTKDFQKNLINALKE